MSVLSRAERQYARGVKNAILGRNVRADRQLRSTNALLNLAELQGKSGSRSSRSSEAERSDREEGSDLARRSAKAPRSKKKRDAAAKAAYDAVMDAPKSAGLLDDLAVFGDDRADVPIDRRPLVGPLPDISYLQPEAAEDRLIQERLRNIESPFSDAEIQADQDEYDAQQRTPERDFADEDEERELAQILANLDVDVDADRGEFEPEDPVYSDEQAREAQAALNVDESDPEAQRVLLNYLAERGDRDALKELRELVDARPRQFTRQAQPLPPQLIPNPTAELPSFIPNI